MAESMSLDEQVIAMERLGIPRDKALAAIGISMPSSASNAGGTMHSSALSFPVRITLPWSALCSDNQREAASLIMKQGKPTPRKVLTAQYKAARDKSAAIAKRVMAGHVPLMQPLVLRALVYMPDERLHDCANFAKCCHDAFERVVYSNDKWLHRVVWERAGVDVDAPRAEISIDPL